MEFIITEFIKPELLILIPVLMILGKIIKDSVLIDSALIPLILGIVGIFLSALWVMTDSTVLSVQEILMAAFVSIVQGLLCAGTAVYGNQLYRQGKECKINKENAAGN